LLLIFADALARGWKQIVNFRPELDTSVVPAPRAARAVPRAAVREAAPADDVAPATPSHSPVSAPVVQAPQWGSFTDDSVFLRDDRGVILAPEASD